MKIEYKTQKIFSEKELQDLFLSVEWYLGKYPDKLVIALRNSSTVFSAWEGNKLIGLINALADGATTAYIPNLLVNPLYHKMGIGKELVRLMTDEYKEYLGIVLIADKNKTGFYEHCGFKEEETQAPLFIISPYN